jgi:hypothetical protein
MGIAQASIGHAAPGTPSNTIKAALCVAVRSDSYTATGRSSRAMCDSHTPPTQLHDPSGAPRRPSLHPTLSMMGGCAAAATKRAPILEPPRRRGWRGSACTALQASPHTQGCRRAARRAAHACIQRGKVDGHSVNPLVQAVEGAVAAPSVLCAARADLVGLKVSPCRAGLYGVQERMPSGAFSSMSVRGAVRSFT